MGKNVPKKNNSSNSKSRCPPPLMLGSEVSLFNRKQIIDKQNKLRKLYQAQKDNPMTEFYKKIKHQYMVYQVGEFIELYSLNPQESYVAKLTKIIKLLEGLQPKAFIEIERVFKKDDLPDPILDKYGEFISAAEVFPSHEKIYLYVQSIKSKCTLITIEEYGELGLTCDTIFYSRSGFDTEKKMILPDPSTWRSECLCKKPTNPDLKYVACARCGRWFHNECVQSKIINGHFMCELCFGNSE